MLKNVPMKTEEINQTIKKNWKTKSIVDIAAIVGLDEKSVRRRATKLKLPAKKTLVPETTEGDFVKFLAKAKTEKEIREKFKDSTDKYLKGKYKGYTFFQQRNQYNELLYILLPVIDKEVKIQPKTWFYKEGVSEEGIPQPYLLVQLPKFKGTIKIALLFDVHYGNFAHKKEKFLSYIRWIKENDDVYAIMGGDIMENALDDGRGMTYDQSENPQTQFEDMVQILAPIAHKILMCTPGNHEHRTYQKTGIDVMRLMAERLKVPYFTGPVWLSLLANGYKWNLFVQHGSGNSQTKGGKMNMANRPKKFTGLIHFFVSGHVHDRVCESETIITDDPINCRLQYLDQWTIIAPAFLGWEETYAYRAGYPPPARGGVAIELDDNGQYRGSLT